MITGWPQDSLSRWPTSRARMSVTPPAGNGTTTRTGFDGQDWPSTLVQAQRSAAAASRTFFKSAFSNHLARQAKAHFAHIVAAKLAQRVAGELGGDLLAPV